MSGKATSMTSRMTKGGPTIEHLFVYGTLRSRANAEERNLLRRKATRIGIGRIEDAGLYLGKYPYAVPGVLSPKPLIGEVYRLDPPTATDVLERLDEYEEFKPNDVEGSLYRREVVQVMVGKQRIPCWIYWYNGSVADIPRSTHGNYLRSDLHVVPNQGGWRVRLSGTGEIALETTTKADALVGAKKLARKRRVDLVIHGRDGRILERIGMKQD